MASRLYRFLLIRLKGKQRATVSVPHEFYPPFNEEQYNFLIGIGYTPDAILAANQPSSPDAKYQRALIDQVLGMGSNVYETGHGESYLMSPSEGYSHEYGEEHGESATGYESVDQHSIVTNHSMITLNMIELIKSNESLRALQEMLLQDMNKTTKFTAMLQDSVKRHKKAGKSYTREWNGPEQKDYDDYKAKGYAADVERKKFDRLQEKLINDNTMSFPEVEACAKQGLLAAAKTME
jgi:hypothetical protein